MKAGIKNNISLTHQVTAENLVSAYLVCRPGVRVAPGFGFPTKNVIQKI